jgi:hypothetical protein
MSAGPRYTVVLHPDDAPFVLPHPGDDHIGCCGWNGQAGRNRLCQCGAEVGTEINDCSTAYELHLDPDRVQTSPSIVWERPMEEPLNLR